MIDPGRDGTPEPTPTPSESVQGVTSEPTGTPPPTGMSSRTQESSGQPLFAALDLPGLRPAGRARRSSPAALDPQLATHASTRAHLQTGGPQARRFLVLALPAGTTKPSNGLEAGTRKY